MVFHTIYNLEWKLTVKRNIVFDSMNQVLEALTTLTSAEAFSMERLELLGDSVLKYVVSCSLYLKYPNKDEGQLSRERQSIISNSNLHRLATDRKLQVSLCK